MNETHSYLNYAIQNQKKNFTELKRLQGLAAKYAGRRNEFQGYIIINFNSYLNHFDDCYFKLLFLSKLLL